MNLTMQNPVQPVVSMTKKQMVYLALTVLLMLAAGLALASTETTFNTANNKLQGWIEGSYGLLAALGIVGTGMAMAVIKHNLWFLAAAAGIGIGATVGPQVLAAMFNVTL